MHPERWATIVAQWTVVCFTCYGSTTTRPGQPYFNTTRPVLGHGFTPNCGCPRNYREGDGCLCEEYFPSSLSTPPVYDKATHSDRKLRESTVLEAPSSAAPKACGRTVVLLPVIPVRPRPRVDPRPPAPLRPRFGDANKISSAKSRQDTSMLSNISEEQTETVPWVFNKIRRSQFNTAINKVNAFPKVLTSSPLIKDIILNNPFDIRNIMHRDQAQMRDSERFLHSNHEYINVQQNTDDRNVSRRVADENTYLKPLLDIVDPQRRQRQSEAGTTVSSLESDEY
nr:uncharacterized protein LOC126055508 [Helicoverpa armigera]